MEKGHNEGPLRHREVAVTFAFDKERHRQGKGSEVEIFEAYLRQKGLKLTVPRRQRLELIFDDHSHFTADQLFDRCRERDVRISKATLYRTLAILTDCKLLSAHDFGGEAKYYEHVFGHEHHDHLVCLACRKIVEFQSPDIEKLQDQAAEELGFAPIHHSLAIFGVCAACAETAEGRKVIEEGQAGPTSVSD